MERKVLVIDDEEGIRKYIRVILSKYSYTVDEVADGEQAIEKILNRKYDIFICDIGLPKKNGWEVLRIIRSNSLNKDVPVIVLTGPNDHEDMMKAYDLGANYYIPKPFTPSQLYYGTLLMFDEIESFWKAGKFKSCA